MSVTEILSSAIETLDHAIEQEKRLRDLLAINLRCSEDRMAHLATARLKAMVTDAARNAANEPHLVTTMDDVRVGDVATWDLYEMVKIVHTGNAGPCADPDCEWFGADEIEIGIEDGECDLCWRADMVVIVRLPRPEDPDGAF